MIRSIDGICRAFGPAFWDDGMSLCDGHIDCSRTFGVLGDGVGDPLSCLQTPVPAAGDALEVDEQIR
ncbi:hypothetical protein A5780_32385 [Nocardia sp. 852002-20019_SCH5090214]|nr:hypothetical protein A5780_32385 [Nocardia sp. 852002-20019_SCH5090214]